MEDDEEEETPQEGTSIEASPLVVEIFESPTQLDKGKGLAVPVASGLDEKGPVAAETARHFA